MSSERTFDAPCGNWIGGARRAASASFAVGEARFARSGEREVDEALEALRAGTTWASLSSSERRELLGAVLERLVDEPDPGRRGAACLGLEEDELALAFGDLRAPLERGLAAQPPVASGSLAFVHPHWSELHAGVARVLAALAAGASVLALSHRRCPALLDAFAAAFHDAGGPQDALAILHDDGEAVLGGVLARRVAQVAWVSGPVEELARVERLAGAPPRPGARRPFGAGVLQAPPTRVVPALLSKSEAHVTRDADPRARARELAQQSLGRAPALGGERAGQVGRIVCDPSRFSTFTEAFLEALEAPDAGFEPRLPLESESAAALAHALQLGLDEGATLIHERGPSDSRAHRPNASVERLVFTNVDAGSRLAALSRPVPLVCLIRAPESDRSN